MTTPARILLVEDAPDEWRIALESFAESGLMDQTTVVKDRGEALDFLYGRGPFRQRASGMPAVVVLGPTMKPATALSTLGDIRNDADLRRLPVVLMGMFDVETKRLAYAQGANSVVGRRDDPKSRAESYAVLGRFWGWANVPPPGCIPQPKASRP